MYHLADAFSRFRCVASAIDGFIGDCGGGVVAAAFDVPCYDVCGDRLLDLLATAREGGVDHHVRSEECAGRGHFDIVYHFLIH